MCELFVDCQLYEECLGCWRFLVDRRASVWSHFHNTNPAGFRVARYSISVPQNEQILVVTTFSNIKSTLLAPRLLHNLTYCITPLIAYGHVSISRAANVVFELFVFYCGTRHIERAESNWQFCFLNVLNRFSHDASFKILLAFRSLVHEVAGGECLFALNRSGPILIIRFCGPLPKFYENFIGKIIHEHLSYQRVRKTEIFESLELSCSSWAWFKLKTNLTTVTLAVFLYKVSFMKIFTFFEKWL